MTDIMDARPLETTRRGWTTIDVLPFLIGRAWDDIAKAYVSALRPSTVRLTHGSVPTDAWTWRVTVCLQGDTIERIYQEVELSLPDGVENGHALSLLVNGENCE